MIEALEALLEGVWQDLERGSRDPRSPYWRPVVAVVHPQRGPLGSTVVVRAVDRPSSAIEWYTDVRSAKSAALRLDSRAAFTWYESRSRVQLRAEGTCVVHAGDDLACARWQTLGAGSRRTYAANPGPGVALDRPEEIEAPELSASQESGLPNFAVVRCRLHRLDRLLIGREGQERAVFERLGSGWIGSWTAP